MKVKITTLGAILLVGILLFVSLYGYGLYTCESEIKETKEGFVDASIQTNGIQLTACPASSNPFINENGDTLCCKGLVSDGKCSGEQICSLSGSQGKPSCSEWYAAYLQETGRGRCPPTLPNYFENESGIKGCTNGPLNKQGTAPATSSSRKCMLYASMADHNEKMDSCANVKFLDEAVCFSGSNAGKTLVATERGKPPVVQCSMVDPTTKTPISCTTDASYARYKETTNDRDWKTKVNNAKGDDVYRKLDFCSVAFKYKVEKSVPYSQLAKEVVFP